MSGVRIVNDKRAIDSIGAGLDVRDLLVESAEPVVGRAQAGAPKRTGAGAGSIRAEPVLDGPDWTVRISWDREHFYMYFHEFGTKRLPDRPFLEPALDGF